jgi:hypothetical protein
MVAAEESNNLPTTTPSAPKADLAVVDISDDGARSALANIAPGDPAVRKRIFSALLRAIWVGGT